jgi:hypothetical protein
VPISGVWEVITCRIMFSPCLRKLPHARTWTMPSTLRCTNAPWPTRNAFWGEHGKRIDWIKPYHEGEERLLRAITDVSYQAGIDDGTLNASANCLDRHLATRGDQTAIIWEGDDPVRLQKV